MKIKSIFKLLALIVLLIVGVILAIPLALNTEWSKGKIAELVTEELGRPVHLNGDVLLELDMDPSLVLTNVRIDGPTPSDPPILTAESLRITGPLIENASGAFEVNELEIDKVQLFFTEDSDGVTNWDFPADPPTPDETEDGSIALPIIRKIDLQDIEITAKLPYEEHELIFDNMLAKNINLSEPNSLATSLKIDGFPLAFSGGTSSIEKFLSGEPLSVRGEVKEEQNQIALDGVLHLDGNTEIALDITGADITSLSDFLDTNLPAFKDYAVKARVSTPDLFANTIIVEDLDFAVEKNDLKGKIEIGLEPLTIKADLQSNAFDLGILDTPTVEEVEETGEKEKETRIPFEIFDDLNADLDLKVGALTTFLGLEFDDAHLAVKIKDGKVSVPELKAKALGGSFTSSIEASRELMKVKLDGTDFYASPISKLAGQEPVLKGAFDFSIDLQGKGETVPAILKTLNGDILLTSEHSTIKNSTLQTTASGLAKILSPLYESSNEVKSECVVFAYKVKDGVAHSKDQVLKLGEVYIFAEGSLDFPKNKMKYNFNVNSTNPALASLIPPFRAYGTLDDPGFAPSVSGTVASLADTAEGVVDSGLGLLQGAVSPLVGLDEEELSGLDVCRKAYQIEQRRLSSQVGSLLEEEVQQEPAP